MFTVTELQYFAGYCPRLMLPSINGASVHPHGRTPGKLRWAASCECTNTASFQTVADEGEAITRHRSASKACLTHLVTYGRLNSFYTVFEVEGHVC